MQSWKRNLLYFHASNLSHPWNNDIHYDVFIGLINCYITLHERKNSSQPPLPKATVSAVENQEQNDKVTITGQDNRVENEDGDEEDVEADADADADTTGDSTQEQKRKKLAATKKNQQEQKMGARASRRKFFKEPDGEQLAKVEDPLAEAAKWVKILVYGLNKADSLKPTLKPWQYVDIYLAQTHVCVLQQNYFLALTALAKAKPFAANVPR